jgi:hypothetical protein
MFAATLVILTAAAYAFHVLTFDQFRVGGGRGWRPRTAGQAVPTLPYPSLGQTVRTGTEPDRIRKESPVR